MIDTCRYRVYFVTGNRHKFEEVSLVGREYGICVEMLPGRKVEIQSSDIMDIAVYSALEAYKEVRKPILVEDAGLFINALNGFPGPYSSYVYKTIGVEGVLKLLQGARDRSAYFLSAVVLIHEPLILRGMARVDGVISESPRGTRGFGFDPIFIPAGETRTFAEMSTEEKNRYSHRARAVHEVFKRLTGMLKT